MKRSRLIISDIFKFDNLDTVINPGDAYVH